jgi:MFS family permease
VIARSLLFLLFGSALWAILPLIAVRRLDLGASGFGILLACVGTGAVLSALVLGWVRERISLEWIVAGAGVLLGTVLALLTVVRAPVLAGALLLLAGAAWIAVVPSLNTAVALVSPPWVRGRALSVWFLGYNGGLAFGSLAWGFLAEVSLTAALLVPAAGLFASVLARRLWPLHADEHVELLPAARLVVPDTVFEPAGRDGPVMVTVAYEVLPGEEVAFAAAARALEKLRRRDGARQWQLYRDAGRERVYVEVFTLATWAEHLRRRDRRTQDDVPIEQRVLGLTRGYQVHYFVGAL